jgi:predicted XRE-type DNA-binding protein
MNQEEFDIMYWTGNVFRDLDHPDADREHLCAVLAARVIRVLDDRKLTVREAHDLAGFAAADVPRIRRVKLGRCTIDRLISILAALGQLVDVTVDVHPQRTA